MRHLNGVHWLAAILLATAAPALADPAGQITGIGGVFVKSKDPKALAAWYRDVLGLDVKSWGGAMIRYHGANRPPMAIWSTFPPESEELAGSASGIVINFTVDDLDAMTTRLAAKGVAILKREEDGTGKFAWIKDPDGTKIEFWQPKAKP